MSVRTRGSPQVTDDGFNEMKDGCKRVTQTRKEVVLLWQAPGQVNRAYTEEKKSEDGLASASSTGSAIHHTGSGAVPQTQLISLSGGSGSVTIPILIPVAILFCIGSRCVLVLALSRRSVLFHCTVLFHLTGAGGHEAGAQEYGSKNHFFHGQSFLGELQEKPF